MIHEIFMPALSSTMTEGKIVAWSKAVGDKVEKGETVLVVESDKADMDVESFNEGYLAAIVVGEGGVATVGAALALLAETEAEMAQAEQQAASLQKGESAPAAPTTDAASPTAPAPPTPVGRNGRIVATPRARKLAKELKVDLAALVGSGPHGRIIAEDVEKSAGRPPTKPTALVPTAPPAPLSPPPAPLPPTPAPLPSTTPGEAVPLNTLQQAVVKNMVASLSVPTFRTGYTITTDALDKLYKQIKSKGVTMTALLAKAVATTLQKYPLLNASYSDRGILYHQDINIAVAVAMEGGGLITPVLANADRVDIYALSRTWKDLVARARAKQLQPQEYNTGTFTLSNLGMFGVDRFDAILPPGQGGILAIGASRPQVVATEDGLIALRRQMQVNLTCDHRIIYGADAAAFLQALAKAIETETHALTL